MAHFSDLLLRWAIVLHHFPIDQRWSIRTHLLSKSHWCSIHFCQFEMIRHMSDRTSMTMDHKYIRNPYLLDQRALSMIWSKLTWRNQMRVSYQITESMAHFVHPPPWTSSQKLCSGLMDSHWSKNNDNALFGNKDHFHLVVNQLLCYPSYWNRISWSTIKYLLHICRHATNAVLHVISKVLLK